jgi:hypothetical protein
MVADGEWGYGLSLPLGLGGSPQRGPGGKRTGAYGVGGKAIREDFPGGRADVKETVMRVASKWGAGG